MWYLLAALALADTCEDAADRYEGCIAEVLGSEMANTAKSKRTEGIAACRKDDKTQQLYVTCLPKPDCPDFMECLTTTAAEIMAGPPKPAGDRKKQCAEHVKQGLAGVRSQFEFLNDGVVDEATVRDHAVQRQKDCEDWDDPLAACILNLEGAKDCNPDEYPFWRGSISTGAKGPKSTWKTSVGEWGFDEPFLGWGPDGVLVVSDPTGIRGLKEGEEIWKVEGEHRHVALTGDAIASWKESGGVKTFAIADGKPRATAADLEIDGLDIVDGAFFFIAGDGALFSLQPKCKGKKCHKPAGRIGEDYLTYSPQLFSVGGVLIVGDKEWFQAYDAQRKPVFDMLIRTYGANEIAPAAPGHIAVVDDNGIALLNAKACQKSGRELWLPWTTWQGSENPEKEEIPASLECPNCALPKPGCVVSWRRSGMGTWQKPMPAGPDAVAFNDHGLIEKTHLVNPSGGWQVKTGGQGNVAADASHVYTISTGLDGEGPVSIMALKITDGRAVWSTPLPKANGEQEEYANYEVVVGSGGLAARVGDQLFGVPLR